MRKISTNKTNKTNKEFNMKLKSILIMTMVAIMAIAGGAMAATTTTTMNQTLDTPGFAGGVSMTFGTGPVCNSVAGGITACAGITTAAQATAFVTEAQTGTGTGLAGGMPAQVVYNPAAYGAGVGGDTAGVGSQTGYQLTQTLFGMCSMTGGVVGACPKFVPAAAAASAATIQGLIISEGGGNAADGGAGTITSSTIPTGTANFNQGTFMTGIVGNMVSAGVINNAFSQKTVHHSVAANATGSADGDFI